MPKVTLETIGSGVGTATLHNSNFQTIEDAFENTISRDGSSPNQMQSALDMNGFNILNQGNAITVEGFNWEGTWSSVTAYQAGDVIEHLGSSYVAIADSTNQEPPNITYWQVVAHSGSLPSIKDYGATGDGVTDDTVAIQNAIDSGAILRVPAVSAFYKITSKLVPVEGGGLVGDGPTSLIKLTGATTDSVIEASGVDNYFLDNIALDGDKATKASSTHCLKMTNCSGWRVPRLWALNAKNWGVGLYGCTSNKFGTVYAEGADTSSGFMLNSTSTLNEINAVYAKNCGGFGVQIFASSDNKIATVVAEDCGLEAVGINYYADRNVIGSVYSTNSGDNGVSITGAQNQIGQVYADSPDFHGLCIYGSNNIVGTVFVRNVGQAGANYGGVAFTPAFGGSAQNNVVGSLVCVDDQGSPSTTHVIKANADANPSWTTATVVPSGSFRKNAGHVYYTVAGGTTGATAPVHLSGSASDDNVTWVYVNPVVDSVNNTVSVVSTNTDLAVPVFGSTRGYFNVGLSNIYHGLGFVSGVTLGVGVVDWAASQSVAWGSWRHNDGNIYICSNAGGTTANEPVHTSGTVTGADGVAWTWMKEDTKAPILDLTTTGPQIYGSMVLTSADNVTVTRRLYVGTSTPSGQVAASPGSIYVRTDASPGIEFYVKAENTDTTGWLTASLRRYGTTASRPSISGAAFTGVEYFDTTIGKPVWYDGSGWVDATGTTA